MPASRPFPRAVPAFFAAVLALVTFALVVARAVRTVDPYWDTLAYHWAYAARAAGLCDSDCLALPWGIENRYDGFPMLLHWLQGMLWRATGTPAAGDLIAIAVLACLCAYLRWRFLVPLAWSWLAFLAIPLVQVHATTSYVDLPANAALAIGILVGVRALAQPQADQRADLAIALAALAVAAGGKLQLAPVAALVWALLVALASRRPAGAGFRSAPTAVAALSTAGALALLPVLAWNAMRFGNPFYPIAFAVGPIRLDGPEGMAQLASLSEAWRSHPGPVRWIASVLEFDAFRGRPLPWTVDQGEVPADSRSFRMGGYFAAYVLALLAIVAWSARACPPARRAAAAVAAASVVCALLPLSHELRYYMFWMLGLVGVALAVAHGPQFAAGRPTALRPALHATVLVALATVVSMTGANYLETGGTKLAQLVAPTRSVVAALAPDATLCVVERHRHAILYSRLFHPGTRHRTLAVDGQGPSTCTARVDPDRR